MNKEYKIKLDLNKKLYNKKMAFNQFDENVNDFYIEVTKNNELVKDLDKSIVTLVAIKPNNTVDAQFIEVKEGQIYADLKPSMCDLVGNYQAKAMIVLEGEIVTTDTINYSVNEDKIISKLNDDVVSDERFTMLTDMLSRLSTIEISEEQRQINEAERILAEENRKIEEAKRRTTEQARVSAENTRVNSENTREANEVARQNNETQRVEAETQRQNRYNSFISDAEANANNFENYTNTAKVKEEERKTNELDRKSQEDRRVSNEVERISNENTRKVSENARIESEKQRVDAENLRNEKIIEIQTDYDSLKKVIIDDNASANLQNQINQTNSQLEHKANDNVVVKKGYATLSDFDEETRAVIQGLEPGTINAVLGEKNVKYTNTDFVEIKFDESPFNPIDLYDKENISEAGYFANLTDGKIVNTQYTQNYVNTGFIKCYSSVRYVLSSVASLCLYDKDKKFISSIENVNNLETITIDDINGRLLNVPEGCEYIICNIYTSNTDNCHIWQLDRYQYTDDCTLTIPRLDLYKNSVFSVNGKKAVNNNINLSATDVGSLEPSKILLSESLPCIIDSELIQSRGTIYTTSDLGEDILIAKSINEFNINGYKYSSALCNYDIDVENYTFTITTNDKINGWYQSYVDIPVTGLAENVNYTLYSKITSLSGYSSDNHVKGINIFNSSMETIASMNQWGNKITFTIPSDGKIFIRLYPSSIAHDGSNELVCKFENIMLCKNNEAVSMFIPYSEQKVELQGNSVAYIDLLPLMTIETEKNIYNNNIEVYRFQEVGKVNTVNNYLPDEYGNINIPKTILADKKIVCFGDSITEFGTYPQQVGDILGATTYNVGVGGCRMSYHPDSRYDGFSMTKLADAIVSKDFSLQEQCLKELIDIKDDNTKSYETLININFDEVDYITIAFGTNDFGGSVPLGTIESDLNNSTFYGSIKYVIETILTTYPHIKLFFMTPIFRWDIPGAGSNSDITPIYGKYLNDYAKAIIDVCYKYHIPVLDMYNKSNINALNHAYYISSDGTHPTDEGYTLIAEKLSKFLLSN